MINVTHTIFVDPEMRRMLNELTEFYITDDGHLIRALLRERLKVINQVRALEGPEG